MNPLERLLQDDLHHLTDRISAATREGTVTECVSRHPQLLARIQAAESSLTRTRQTLLDEYAVWRAALEGYADLWALADLAAEPPPMCAPRQAA